MVVGRGAEELVMSVHLYLVLALLFETMSSPEIRQKSIGK